MTARLLELRKYIETVTVETNDKVLEEHQLSAVEWNTLKFVQDVFKSFFQATEALEGDKYPTLSLVGLLFNGILRTQQKLIRQDMGKTVQTLVVSLLKELSQRTVNSASELRNMVMMFDPRTKREATFEM